MIFDLHWWLALTPHQLDVVRTLATVIGSAFIPLLGFLLGWIIKVVRAARREATRAAEQTSHQERVGGELRTVSVTDYARHAADGARRSEVSSAATRQEVSDLGGWVKGHGRYREPTRDVPRIDPEESTYE